jgi:hypothetical protein
MRHCRLYEEQGEEMVLDGEGGEKKRKKQKSLFTDMTGCLRKLE